MTLIELGMENYNDEGKVKIGRVKQVEYVRDTNWNMDTYPIRDILERKAMRTAIHVAAPEKAEYYIILGSYFIKNRWWELKEDYGMEVQYFSTDID